MKHLPRSLKRAFACALGSALLCACASLPQAKPGLYVNQEHRFSLSYPESWQRQPLQHDEVFRAANPTPHRVPVVTAAVVEQRNAAPPDAQAFTEAMQQRIPGTSQFKVLSQEDVKLNDATPAKAFVFEWIWTDGATKMVTAALVTNKDGRHYNTTVTTIPPAGPKPEQMLDLVKSWEFH